jgi:hypothetical protein
MQGRVNAILATVAGGLAAAVLGVLLGRSAIAEINPAYFQPLDPPRAVDPNPPQADSAFAQAYGWGDGQAAHAADCGDNCIGLAAGDPYAFSYPPPIPRAGGPYWRDPSPTTEPAPWPPGEVGPRRDNVERYTHYPIEEAAPDAIPLKVPSDGAESDESEPDGGK